MNKKHLWGILVVLAISAFVLYADLKATPISEILRAAHGLNIFALIMVFALMLLSYVCEAGILATLAHRKKEPKRSAWSFLRIPIIQALFNAITPMSTGGQPSQLAAMIQMGMEGGRSTSILLMKFIIYQIVVLFAYVFTIIFGFHMVMTKFAGLAIFIAIGFLIHVSSIIFLLAIMFAYRFTKKATNWLMDLLAKMMKKERVEKWRKATLEKIDTFYAESQKLKKEKIICCLAFNSIAATFLLLHSIYGINSAKCTLFLVSSYANEYNDYHVYGDHSYSRCVRRGRI